MALMLAARSLRRLLMEWVAPNSQASFRRRLLMSTAMIVLALTMRAAITAASPTEPAPKTAMLDPARTASEFITVPAPVCRPQPNGASNSSGSDIGTFTRLHTVARAWVANDDWRSEERRAGK